MRIGYFGFLILLMAPITTCVHNLPPDNLSLETIREKQKSQNVQKQLLKIEEVRNQYPDMKPFLQDIYLILKAVEAENKRQFDDALGYWKEGLSLPSEEFSEEIFKGWLNQFLRSSGPPKDIPLLAKLILSETNKGRESYFLTREELTAEQPLSAWLVKLFPDAIMSKNYLKNDSPQEIVYTLPPDQPGIPLGDPLFRETSKQYCQAKNPGAYQWNAWKESLGPLGGAYWQALIHQCKNEPALAIQILKDVLRNRSKRLESENYLIVAAHEVLVLLLRRNDARDEAASWYKSLVESWSLPGVSPEAMGIDLQEFLFKQIDDALWAARYRSLIGDYAHGKIYVRTATELMDSARVDLPSLTPEITEKLSEFKAEAWHILSFRIAMEQQEFSHAAALAKSGLEIPHLSTEWKERFLWYQGLYEYLDGNINRSWQIWSDLNQQTKAQAHRYKTLFWLSYLAHKKGMPEKSLRLLHTLGEESPLDFYYVVAPLLAKMPTSDHWQGRFLFPEKLEQKLEKARDYNTSSLRNHEKIAPLLARTEVLLLAGLNQWALPVSTKLAEQVLKRFSVVKEPDAYLYLSRLLYGARNYHKSISLSRELSQLDPQFWKKSPEQIHISFPRAFSKSFGYSASTTGVAVSTLYGISRQESLFLPDARSYASALGLMQIIAPTALRVAAWGNVNLPGGNIEKHLLDIDTNISLGSLYLQILERHFRKNIPAMIASYNAGEYAVDMWLQRRNHPDPLVWIEMIPFGETRSYVQNVWRNKMVYEYLGADRNEIVFKPERPRLMHAARDEQKEKARR